MSMVLYGNRAAFGTLEHQLCTPKMGTYSLNSLDRWSTGTQVLKSADSITANLVEGFGRKQCF